ncbi:hypothetical protein MMC28_010492 [Mycoblastus sanguinarius]|nr:hypothetical protein [Mycoblastus sanguinarius]
MALTRLILIVQKPIILSSAPGSDPSWDTVPLLYVTSLEAPFGIVALCGPPINQFFHRLHSFGWRSLLTTKKYSSDVTPLGNVNKPLSLDRSNRKNGSNWMDGSSLDTEETAVTDSQMQIRREDTIDVELQALKHQGAGFASM